MFTKKVAGFDAYQILQKLTDIMLILHIAYTLKLIKNNKRSYK